MNSFLKFSRQVGGLCILSLLMLCVNAKSQTVAGVSTPAVQIAAAASIASASPAILATPASPMQLSANIPVIRDNGKGKTDDISFAWLITVLALILAFAYVVIKFKSGTFNLGGRLPGLDKKSTNSELKIKKQLMLTAKTSIHLISWNGDELLIACSDNQVTVLDKKKMDLPTISDANAETEFSPQQNGQT
ncbi:flagellar biosynthetic protein FliO [Undibacterium sp. Ji83W]|uniref:flagellar biosynthetic protein FliO n=1 Tax=Undibacterium sp. Ji83W TaxID=3413043 RepID=UPI003BF1C848